MSDSKPTRTTDHVSIVAENTDTHVSQPVSVEVVPGGPVSGSVRPPGSKSLTNRALVCAAFADGASTLVGTLRSEDTAVMIESLQKIGVAVDVSDGGRTLRVQPNDRSSMIHGSEEPIEMFIANSGTTVRFLVAALSAAGGRYRLSGVTRMHQRPIQDLSDAIASVIDGTLATESEGGCPPVLIDSAGWKRRSLSVGGNVSSQYLSGLMMAAPIALAHNDRSNKNDESSVRIAVNGELVSLPYVQMTAKVMKDFGSTVSVIDADDGVAADGVTADGVTVQIESGGYKGTEYSIEPDASAASYFWAAAAITGGQVTVQGLSRDAIQGDVGFVDVLEQMGCQVTHTADSITVVGKPLTGIDVDMNAISDTVQTLAVVALFADGPTRVRGVAHNRFKETDRIGDLATELRKIGATVNEHEDGMTITPPANLETRRTEPVMLETYHDHRMAMSLSLAGLRMAGIRILDPACTCKTYPEYFADLETLIGRPHRWV